MKKLLKLYKMLNKNSRGAEKTKAGSKFSLNVNGSFLAAVGLLIAIGLGWLCWKNADLINALGGVPALLQLGGLLAAILIIFFSALTLINSMYMSSDIEILITLPFSAVEIAVMRVLPVLQLAVGGTLILLLAPCIGMALAGPVPAAAWAAIIFTTILLPVFVVSLVAIVVILLMSFLKIFRSRETLQHIGIVFLFLALCAYTYMCTGRHVDMQALTAKMVSIAAKIKYAVPVVGASVDFVNTGNVLYLLLDVVLAAAALILFVPVTKALYLQGALSMQDAGNSKVLTDSEFDKYCRKRSPMKALMAKEFYLTRRDPAYVLYNYIVGLLWPVLIVIIMLQAIPVLQEITASADFRQIEENLTLESFTLISAVISAVALLLVGIPISMQTLAFSSLSREGKSFYIMKQLPVSYADQLEAKRRVASKVAQFSITGYTILLLIAVSVFLKISYVYCILPIILVCLYAEFRVNLDMYLGIRSANVTWDDEKAAGKKNTPISLLGMLLMLVSCALPGVIAFCQVIEIFSVLICLLLLLAVGAVFAAAAFWLRKMSMTGGEKQILSMKF